MIEEEDDVIVRYEIPTVSASESGLEPGLYFVNIRGFVEPIPVDEWEAIRTFQVGYDEDGNEIDALEVFEVIGG